MALPRSLRFRDRREIKAVFRARGSGHTQLGRVWLAPPHGARGRILFIVPRAVAKASTRRNQIKRVLDDWAYRRSVSERLGRDLVVMVSPTVARLSNVSLRALADSALIALTTSARNA